MKNVMAQNGMNDCFTTLICSELIGESKPSSCMFKAAMDACNLNEGDRSRVIMVGNNLARDVNGANLMGLRSVFMDWSPRYPKIPADDSEKPNYSIHTLIELISLAHKLEIGLRNH
jgi:FMN phosphatase YigB (HAD superfamily)